MSNLGRIPQPPTPEAVLDWLRQLEANARRVNDGEGRPLAENCVAARAVIATLTDTTLPLAVRDLEQAATARDQVLAALVEVEAARDQALAALVAKWRETATVPCDGSEWDAGATYMLMECADQLAALLTHEAP